MTDIWPGRHSGDNIISWPAPEVVYRPAAEDEIPIGARRVLDAARAAGWTVEVTYARGTHPGRIPRVVDSIALRMRHGRHRAIAFWHNGKFDTAVTFGEHPIRRCNTQALRAALRAPHQPPEVAA